MNHLNGLLLTLFLTCINLIFAQTQKGLDIDGLGVDSRSGHSVSINSDGNTLVIGAPGIAELPGYVAIYSWNGSAWVPKGSEIFGEEVGDSNGYSVAISSDGNTVIIGASFNDGTGSNSGQARVFEWDGADWIQKGLDIEGEAEEDHSGWSVAINSEGNTIAIGAIGNNGTGDEAGHVRVYFWGISGWVQRGVDIDGEAEEDHSGSSVSMSSDGNTIAIGAVNNNEILVNQGHVRIYKWDGLTWIQKGMDIDGEGALDLSGRSVSLSSDGNCVAIGADHNSGEAMFSGHVRIYEWNDIAWIQKGVDIDGEAEGDRSGKSVSLSSDGNTVAIGAPQNDGSAENAGHVRIYEWDGFEWIQKGIDIDGETEGDWSGVSVSLNSDGTTVAIGAPWNDDAGNNAGHVRVYEFCEDITNSISSEACYTYTVPSGDETYLESGIYMDTIPRAFNCGDSILTIDVTINFVSVDVSIIAFDTLQAAASGIGISYQWIDCSDSSEIAGATEQTFGAPTNGSYAVIINQDGCVDTSACYEIEGVGISEILFKEIKIYPNPSSGLIYVQAENSEMESIKLYNSVGQLVKTWTVSSANAELNLQNFERGIYMVVIETAEGLVRKQIVLQ